MNLGYSQSSIRPTREHRLISALNQECINLELLQDLLWSGIPKGSPPELRRDAWQVMLGYLPPRRDRVDSYKSKKANEYSILVNEHIKNENHSEQEKRLLRQIKVDLPRTSLEYKSLRNEKIFMMMERILFLWAIRNPASGYVQGINDLLPPFLVVFLLPLCPEGEMDQLDIENISIDQMFEIEVGIYWCLTRMLDTLQENYVSEQPGIHKLILYLQEVIRRTDKKLFDHLKNQGVDFIQFSFRWANCLLTREFPIRCIVRLWDTYIAENTLNKTNKYTRSSSITTLDRQSSNVLISHFNAFHAYVCAAFLMHWRKELEKMDFAGIMLFLQNTPAQNWTEREIDSLLAQAFVLQSLFHSSPRHLIDYSQDK
ncbi:TBC domain [Cryptosporidium bovis]|uniref:TBC domain n=1 Tax=Cryptosporidium bovis TaxID=310047 RepID=UPI00351A433D|nr:TBC domain [Cryptosporidium bovis]